MEDHTNTRQLIVPLIKSHPIFTLDEPKRNQFIKELLDQYALNTPPLQKELALLNTKVDTLATKMELVQDVLETVMAIKKTMEKSVAERPLPAQVAPTIKPPSEKHKETLPSENNKQVTFDVDAFLDLG